MAITPADIEQLTFSPSKHGYDTEEVDAFLEQLTGEVSAMLQKMADLKSRLNASEQQLAAAQAQVAELRDQQAAAPAPVVEPAPSTLGASESQISKVLIVAQQSADKIVSEARESADQIRTEADQKAREVIRQALAEKQNELDEIDRLKASREEFRTEYKNLLQHFMDDADAAFPNQVLSAPNGSAATYRAAAPVATPSAVEAGATAPQPAAPAMPAVNLDDLD
ncbi:MAG: DivIVA domain-containing protein [Atopobiaceae bacterium]|nr:DivIVA domain-containing protein [Atopobiaceae bacterium]